MIHSELTLMSSYKPLVAMQAAEVFAIQCGPTTKTFKAASKEIQKLYDPSTQSRTVWDTLDEMELILNSRRKGLSGNSSPNFHHGEADGGNDCSEQLKTHCVKCLERHFSPFLS